MKLIWQYTKKYPKFLLLNLLGAGGFVLIQLGIPTLLKYVLNDSLRQGNVTLLLTLVGWMLVFLLVGFSGNVCLAFANSRISTNVIRDLRRDLFLKTQRLSHAEVEEIGVSALITCTTSDAYQIMLFSQMLLRAGFITPVMMVSGLMMALTTSISLSRFLLAIVPALVLGIFLVARASHPISKAQQKTLDRINLILRENLSGFRVIRAFRNESFQSERFDEVNETYTQISKKLFRLMGFSMPGFNFLFCTAIVMTLWMGSKEVGLSNLDVGTLAIFIEYIYHVLMAFLMMAILIVMYPRASVSAKRIERILATEPSVRDEGQVVEEGKGDGSLVFEQVTFAYPGAAQEPVLREISFTVKKGETVAFIGSTGSGKSTLIQLIPRFFDVTKGRILLDGVDLRHYRLDALRGKIGFVPQKATLFTGTIRENLCFGKINATDEELLWAADIARAKDFILRRENGFDEHLSEGGSNLSGGQKQRLAIARAVLGNPQFYIFDDSFSALDYQTDLALRTRLRHEMAEATVLIVAQRVGTIMFADRIFVLDEGRLVAEGTHQELLKTSAIYYDIASSQLSKEELNK